jgi:uncharacterized membrane protein YgcG
MLKRFTQLGLLCCFVFCWGTIHAASINDFIVPRGFTFNKDLYKLTDVIPDVYFLQNLLNMSTSTRVSESGKGANGKLTSYYGDRTESAVGRFQQIFKTDIEYEKSISTTTGALNYKLNAKIVDRYTRAVMNKLVVIYQNQLDQYNSTKNYSTTTLPFSSSTTFQTGVKKKDEKFDPEKAGFQYSPQGLLLKLVGGNELVDKVYGYTPSGMLGGGGSGGGGGGAGSFSVGGGGGSSASTILPFGGLVTSMTTCTCSFNLLLYVKDVRGTVLPLMYQPGATILYKMYTPTSGVNVLGKYTTGGQCLIYVGTSCSTGGTPVGTMIQLGTSAL